MTQQTEERRLQVPSFSVFTFGDRFVEIHFDDGIKPPKETREYLRENGFRFYENCNGREEPRYGARQSTKAWSFVQQFNKDYGHEHLPDEIIPDQYRLRLEEAVRSPTYTAPAPIAAPPTLVIPQPPPETKPMTRTKAASPGQLDFMAMFEDIFAIANEAVAELDEAAQRRAKLLAEIEKWKDWRADWIGGEYRWILVNSAIGMMMTDSALALVKESCNSPTLLNVAIEAQESTNRNDELRKAGLDLLAFALVDESLYELGDEDESLKKHEPLLPPKTNKKTAEEAQADTTTETHADRPGSEESIFILTPPSSPEPKQRAKKTSTPKKKEKGEGGRRQSPTLGEPAFWLDDDDLRGTEQYIGCYAVLDGRVGLSFKGLSSPVEAVFKRRRIVTTDPKKTEVVQERYTAQPGTFQPLEMDRVTEDCISGMIAIAESFARLTSAEGDSTVDEGEVEALRESLNFAYDRFAFDHGYLHDKRNKALTSFCDNTDIRLYMLMALEQEDSDNGGYTKASIFYDRQQYPSPPPTTQLYYDEDPVERIKLAYAKCMDERGLRLDIDLIAALAGMEPDEAEEYLLSGETPLAYRMPIE